MNKSIWEWLEIEPTGEISEIRAAYARQVKKYHPEDTPEEFEQLQKAYKSALRQARAAKRTETVPQSVQESQKSGRGCRNALYLSNLTDWRAFLTSASYFPASFFRNMAFAITPLSPLG